MTCRGVHFALTAEEVEQLRSFEDDDERVEYLSEEIEEMYFDRHPEFVAESDKAWDAIHRALADGELTWEGGEYPLNHVILGGELLCSGDDYVMSLKTPEQVREIAAVLPAIGEEEFRQRYLAIDPDNYEQGLSDDDLQYTWDWFQDVRAFYLRAAQHGRYVLFTVDQ